MAMDEEKLLKKVLGDEPPRSDDRLTDEQQFISHLVRRIMAWYEANEKSQDFKDHSPVMFVLSRTTPDLETLDEIAVTGEVYLTIPDYPFGASLLFCDVSCQRARGMDRKFSSGSEAVSFATNRNLLDHSFAILLPAQKRLMIHTAGSPAEAILSQKFEISGDRKLTYRILKKDLREFHEIATKFPQGACAIWKNAKLYELKERAEDQIQGLLWIILVTKYESRSTDVDRETYTHLGRSDIKVIHRGPSAEDDIGVVIELKVLSEAKTIKKNIEWIEHGLRQASDYRKTSDKIKKGWLSCYDARINHDAFPQSVSDLAKKLKIKVFHFKLYNKTKH